MGRNHRRIGFSAEVSLLLERKQSGLGIMAFSLAQACVNRISTHNAVDCSSEGAKPQGKT
jgi:hypothetical protein